MNTDDNNSFGTRLKNPRWDDVQKVTGGVPSAALVALYTDDMLLRQKDFFVSSYSPDREDMVEEQIIHFLPADEFTLDHPGREDLPPSAFPFAEDIYGDLLYVELSPAGDDSMVKHWYHDGGRIETIAPTLEAFIQSCKGRAPN